MIKLIMSSIRKEKAYLFLKNFSFLCDCEGHIEEPRIKAALEELGLHCKSLEIIGVYEASSFRQL